MRRRCAPVLAVLVLGLAMLPPPVEAQTAPRLSKRERQALEALVAAVDRAAAGEAPPLEAVWQHHVLRVSDGGHYVALRALLPGQPAPAGKVATYVRLATRRRAFETSTPERSAVREWLVGLRGDPLPMQPGRVTTVPVGEMPIGGAAASTRRPSEAVDATSALRLMGMHQERAARDQAEREARRLAALEREGARLSEMLPFEDFEFETAPKATPDGLEVQRGLTGGPGEFDAYVAWTTIGDRASSPQVLRYSLSLPAATAAFGLSDLIVAERAAPLTTAYAPTQQGAHPYALGALEVTPALGNILPADGSLGLVFQVINPSGSIAGKPDVDVSFDVARMVDDRLTAFGSLIPQHYDEQSLPADFDTAKGHPLFGAVRAPLASFPRGRYRITATALDRRTGQRASREAFFTVRGTPESLLREAPGVETAFRREHALGAATRQALSRQLRTEPCSPSLTLALDALEAGRFADLVQLDTASPEERGRMLALLAVGLFGLGDSPRTVLSRISLAQAQGAPAAVVDFVIAAAAAAAGDDRQAVAAWSTARAQGLDDALVAPLLVDGYLRLRDTSRAAAVATSALDVQPANAALRRALAATYIAERRYIDALRVLDAMGSDAADQDTDFLVLHALYAGWVDQLRGLTDEPSRQRLTELGRRYVEGGGRHAALVREWLPFASSPR